MNSPCFTMFGVSGGAPRIIQHDLFTRMLVHQQSSMGPLSMSIFSPPRTFPRWLLFPAEEPGLFTCGSGLQEHKSSSCQCFLTPGLRGLRTELSPHSIGQSGHRPGPESVGWRKGLPVSWGRDSLRKGSHLWRLSYKSHVMCSISSSTFQKHGFQRLQRFHLNTLFYLTKPLIMIL